MDFQEKAKIRIEHWMSHNDSHVKEYEEFANELEKEGKKACANHIKEMIDLTVKSNEALKKAIGAL